MEVDSCFRAHVYISLLSTKSKLKKKKKNPSRSEESEHLLRDSQSLRLCLDLKSLEDAVKEKENVSLYLLRKTLFLSFTNPSRKCATLMTSKMWHDAVRISKKIGVGIKGHMFQTHSASIEVDFARDILILDLQWISLVNWRIEKEETNL